VQNASGEIKMEEKILNNFHLSQSEKKLHNNISAIIIISPNQGKLTKKGVTQQNCIKI